MRVRCGFEPMLGCDPTMPQVFISQRLFALAELPIGSGPIPTAGCTPSDGSRASIDADQRVVSMSVSGAILIIISKSTDWCDPLANF